MQVKKLEEGQCDSLSSQGFTCVEHYQCIGAGVTLATTGNSTTKVISIITQVNVSQTVASNPTYRYGFSILDATDKTCETYTKVSSYLRSRADLKTALCSLFSVLGLLWTTN